MGSVINSTHVTLVSGVGWPPSTSLFWNSLLTSMDQVWTCVYCKGIECGEANSNFANSFARQTSRPLHWSRWCDKGQLTSGEDSPDGENRLDARTLDCRKAVYGSLPTHRWKGCRFNCESEEAIQAGIPKRSIDIWDSPTTVCGRINCYPPGTTSRKPKSLDVAVESAQGVEYTLNFETRSTTSNTKEINVIGKLHPVEDLSTQLQQTLDQMAN